MINTSSSPTFLSKTALLTAFVVITQYCVLVAHASDIYCTRECTSGNADDPCGDSKGQQETCISPDFISSGMEGKFGYGKFGYDESKPKPTGFLGCSATVCESACKDIENKQMVVLVESDGVKTFCFPKRDSSMFMMEDIAEMFAVAQGCAGAHKMGEMYMHGSDHNACMKSYDMSGIAFGEKSSSFRSIVNLPVVVISISTIVLTLMI